MSVAAAFRLLFEMIKRHVSQTHLLSLLVHLYRETNEIQHYTLFVPPLRGQLFYTMAGAGVAAAYGIRVISRPT